MSDEAEKTWLYLRNTPWEKLRESERLLFRELFHRHDEVKFWKPIALVSLWGVLALSLAWWML